MPRDPVTVSLRDGQSFHFVPEPGFALTLLTAARSRWRGSTWQFSFRLAPSTDPSLVHWLRATRGQLTWDVFDPSDLAPLTIPAPEATLPPARERRRNRP